MQNFKEEVKDVLSCIDDEVKEIRYMIEGAIEDIEKIEFGVGESEEKLESDVDGIVSSLVHITRKCEELKSNLY